MDSEDYSNIKAIVLDIEGTSTSISFVKDSLFPYVRKTLSAYLDANWENEGLKGDVKLLIQQAESDLAAGVEGAVTILEGDEAKESVAKNVLWQMDCDKKTTALKQLQGHIWAEGYASGDLKGHVYEDVPVALREWVASGRRVYVYSSGSVDAQKLLFKHSEAGDLLAHFSGHFDTTTGPKTVQDSYTTIAKAIDVPPQDLLFLTDVLAEASAAKAAGVRAVLVVREGNAPLTDEARQEFHTVSSLGELVLQRCAKRAKTCTDEAIATTTEPAVTVAAPVETAPAEAPVVEETEAMEVDTAEPVCEKMSIEDVPAAPVAAETTEEPAAPAAAETTEEPAAPAAAETTEEPAAPAAAETTEEPAAPAAAETAEEPATPAAAETSDLPAAIATSPSPATALESAETPELPAAATTPSPAPVLESAETTPLPAAPESAFAEAESESPAALVENSDKAAATPGEKDGETEKETDKTAEPAEGKTKAETVAVTEPETLPDVMAAQEGQPEIPEEIKVESEVKTTNGDVTNGDGAVNGEDKENVEKLNGHTELNGKGDVEVPVVAGDTEPLPAKKVEEAVEAPPTVAVAAGAQ